MSNLRTIPREVLQEKDTFLKKINLAMTLYRLVVSRPQTFSQDERVRRQLPVCYWDEGIVSALSNQSINAMSAHPILEGQYLPRVRLFAG